MRRIASIILFAATLFGPLSLHAQESIPPIPVGGGQTQTRISNGQEIQVSAVGVTASITFSEISCLRVTGVALRVSSGTTSGTVTIRWVNRGREVTLLLGPLTPEVPFGMEGGDIDKRSGGGVSSP